MVYIVVSDTLHLFTGTRFHLHRQTDGLALALAGWPRGAMLSVRKTALITGLKVGGLEVRKAELDFYILRYIMTSGVATVWTGECHAASLTHPSAPMAACI